MNRSMMTSFDDPIILHHGIYVDVSYYYLQNKSNGLYTGDGSVDLHGNPILKEKTGNWKACPFILGAVFIVLQSSYCSLI